MAKTKKSEKEFEPRKYVCARWPYLRLRKGIKFDKGIYIANTEELAEIVESNEQFGGLIRRVMDSKAIEPKLDPIEQELVEVLRKSEPGVRRGAISTANILG